MKVPVLAGLPVRKWWRICLGAAMVAAVLASAAAQGGVLDYFRNGFKVGPEYRAPDVWVTEGWIDERDPRLCRKPALTLNWWGVFDDPVLCNLVELALQQNLSIREACYRIEEAESQWGVAWGSLWPQIQRVNGADIRIRVLENEKDLISGGPTTPQAANIPTLITLPGASPVAITAPGEAEVDWARARNLNLAAAWELDFWGKYRRSVEAANAVLESSVSGSDAVVVLVTAQVADAYIELRTFEELLRQAEKDRRVLERVKAQAEANSGASETLTLRMINLLLASVDAEASVFRTGKRAANNSLCVLLGMPPAELELGRRPIPEAPEKIAVGIPCELIRRRPDVVRLERLAAAESARIGVAEANFYPSISLAGKLTGNRRRIDDIVETETGIGAYGAIFNWNILDYGRTANRAREQKTRFEQAVLRYQEGVIRANSEAETAITTYLNSLDRSRALAKARKETEKITAELLPRVTAGEDLGLLFSVTSFSFPYRSIQARGAVARNLVTLYKVLGGGWETRLVRQAGR